MAQGPRKGKMKSSPKAKTIAAIPRDLVKVRDPKTGEIYYRERYVHPTKT